MIFGLDICELMHLPGETWIQSIAQSMVWRLSLE